MKQLSSRIALSATLLTACVLLPQAVLGVEKRCARTMQQVALAKPLSNISEKVAAGESIRIVAFGSSSTEGTPDIPKAEIFPNVMAEELAQELATPVELVNKGKGGDTIEKMAARLEQDVLNLKPDLVIWQLGVNDVLTMDGVAPAIAQMREALMRFKARKLPVVLVDLQVSPLVERDRDTPAMQDAIIQAAQAEGVFHFNRFGEMKALISSQSAEMVDLVQPDQLHMTKLGHFCTGKLLAQQIARASFGNASLLYPRE